MLQFQAVGITNGPCDDELGAAAELEPGVGVAELEPATGVAELEPGVGVAALELGIGVEDPELRTGVAELEAESEDSSTGQTVVEIAIVLVTTKAEVWDSGWAGQLVTVGAQDVI